MMQPAGANSAARTPLALFDPGDTIAALASPPGPAARSIIRLSGPKAHAIALAGFSASPHATSKHRRLATLRCGMLLVSGLRRPLPVMLALWPARGRTRHRTWPRSIWSVHRPS